MTVSEKGMFSLLQAAILAGSGLLAMAAAAAFSYLWLCLFKVPD